MEERVSSAIGHRGLIRSVVGQSQELPLPQKQAWPGEPWLPAGLPAKELRPLLRTTQTRTGLNLRVLPAGAGHQARLSNLRSHDCGFGGAQTTSSCSAKALKHNHCFQIVGSVWVESLVHSPVKCEQLKGRQIQYPLLPFRHPGLKCNAEIGL